MAAPNTYPDPNMNGNNTPPDASNLSSSSQGEKEKIPDVENGAAPAPAPGPPPFKPPPGMAPADFPDGGLTAWSVCLGAFCCLFASFGWITCIGVFQTYYQTHQLKSYSSSDVAWIPSVEIFMMQVFAPVFGKVFDGYGPRGLLIFGTFFHIFGLMMTSLGKEYYQLFLAQAVCSGMGASALFYAGTNSLLTWFFKRRALATGIAASGASLGGVIMPIMINRLIPRIGFGWTMRALAFMLFGLLLIANVTVKSRLPHKPKPWKVMDFVVPLKEPKFLFLALGSFFFFWGLFLPINFIVLYAQHYGMSESLSNYQLPILNAGSVFGRIIPGYLGDRFGRFNVTIATTVFSTITILALWIPGTSNAAIIVFSILYGFASGAFVAMVAALVAQVSDIRQIGVRNGTNFFVISWAALTGNPIAGALISHNNGGYIGLQIFGGVVIFVGALFFIASRHVQVGPGLKKC